MKKQLHIINKVGVTLALGNIISRHNVFIWNGTSKSAPSRFILDGKTLTDSMQSHWLVPNIYDDTKIVEDEMADVLKEYPQCNIAKICEQTRVYQQIGIIVAQLDKSLPLIGGELYSLNGNVIRLTDEHEVYSVDGKPKVLCGIRAIVDIKIMFRVEGEMFSLISNSSCWHLSIERGGVLSPV